MPALSQFCDLLADIEEFTTREPGSEEDHGSSRFNVHRTGVSRAHMIPMEQQSQFAVSVILDTKDKKMAENISRACGAQLYVKFDANDDGVVLEGKVLQN